MKKHIFLSLFGAFLFPLACSAQKQENKNSAVSRNLEIFNEIYKQLDLYYVDSLNADSVIGWGIRSMLRQIDPFTDYYPQDDEELRQMATGKYAGIGSLIRYSKKHERAVINEPYEGTPSHKAGLKMGDVILSIDGKDVKGMSTEKVSEKLRGEQGTSFELRIQRGKEEKAFLITRENIQQPQVPYFGLLRPEVGYIYLTGFTDGAFREFNIALQELRTQGAKSLIVDLRDNPGGALEEAVDITNLFVPKGRKVVYTKGKVNATNREYKTATEPVDSLMPLVVLVDGGSASAAEILSGSLQDMDRAVIVGARTYGKGFVQQIRELPYHSNLKITTSRYYIPSGRCIQAYDYRHRKEDGSVGTIPDSLTNVFHTANGREVRDGGGIKPDVEIEPDSLPNLIYDLVASEEYFEYLVQYTREHSSIAPAGQFRLSDEEYQQFVDYMEISGFKYNRRSDEVLKLLRKTAKQEGYLQGAEQEFEALENKFKYDLRGDLFRFRHKIELFLCDDIVRSYYFERGAVQQTLIEDSSVEKALDILAHPEEYRRILSAPVSSH